jgi:Gas vesicle synthesis protein GvpL/GvpF
MASGVEQAKGTAIYLYGVTQKDTSPGRLLGVDGVNAVETLPCAGLFSWISRVSRKEFADNLSANMENLDWLAEASVHHQRVVSAIARVADILPARFGTVFLSEASLQSDVRGKKRVLQNDFSRIHDSDEFGVKIFGVLANVELPQLPARTGKDYLKAKAALLQRRPPKKPYQDSDFQNFESELAKLAVETAQAGRISGGQRGLQWQISVLLRRADRRKFDAILRKYSRQWAGAKQIECTGPWPPYSFVSRSERAKTE